MKIEDRVVGQAVAILVRTELLTESEDVPMLRLVGFEGDEVREAMRILTSDEKIMAREVDLKVATHRVWQGDPPAWFLAKDETQVQFRNNSVNGLVLFEVEEQPDAQSLRNMHCIQDGTILEPEVGGGGADRRRSIVELAWALLDGKDRPVSEDLMDVLEEVFGVVERESGQLALRAWVEFVVRCATRVAKATGAAPRSTVQSAVVEELPWLRLFHDEGLFEASGRLDTKRLVRNVRMAGMASPTGKELDEEEIERRIESAVFRVDDGVPPSDSEQEVWRERCISVLQGRAPEQYRAVPFDVWALIFAKEKEAREGLGTRILSHLEDTAPHRVGEYEGLELQTGLDDQEPPAAKQLLDAESEIADEPALCDLLNKRLRKSVEKLANPRSPTVSDPLVALLQHLYDVLAEDDEGLESVELGVEESREGGGDYSLALFRFMYARTLEEIAEGSKDEHDVSFSVAEKLVHGPVDFHQLHFERHGGDNTNVDEDASSKEDEAVDRGWEDLRLQLTTQPGNRVVRRFTWSASDPRLPAGLVAVSRLVAEGARVARVAGSWPDLEAWCSDMLDPRNALLGDRPVGASHGPVEQWLGLRDRAFSKWRQAGFSCDRISDYVDQWRGVLDRVLGECVPKQQEHPELESVLEIETFRPGSDRLVLLATHPIRLRWVAAYLRLLRGHIRSVLDRRFRLNPEVEELFFTKISEFSPHLQPPVMSPGHQALSVATREFGWHEEYRPIVEEDAPSEGWVSSIDGESVSAIAGIVKRYLESHPHKIDGLSLLFISRDGEAEHVERLVRDVRSVEGQAQVLTIHVIAPQSSHEEIVRKLEGLVTEERSQLDLLPRLRTILHPITVLDSTDEARDLGLEHQVDLVIVPNLFGLRTSVQTNTQQRRSGSFDALLDDPTHDTSGDDGGGRVNVSRDFIPFHGDALLEGWSSLQVWRRNWQRVGKEDPDQVNHFSLQVLFSASAELFGLLHRWGHWVVTLDPYVGRDQVEASAQRPDVITVQPKVGKNGRYTMVVSSSTGRDFVVDRLTRRISSVLGCDDSSAAELADAIYRSSRDFAPGVVLRALGLGRTTQEILGLVVSRRIIEERRPRPADCAVEAWLSLDELPHWFGGAHRPRADMLRVIVRRRAEGIAILFHAIEAKFREREDRGKGEMQLSRTREVLEPAFQVGSEPDSEFADAAIWRRELLAAIEQCAGRSPGEESSSGLWVRAEEGSKGLPEDLRTALLQGEYEFEGFESILCTVAASDTSVTEEETRSPDGGHAWMRVGAEGFGRVLGALGTESRSIDGEEGLSSMETSHPQPPAEPEPDSPRDAAPKSTEEASERAAALESSEAAEVARTTGARGIGAEGLERRYQLVLNLFSEFKISVERPKDYSPMEGPAFYEVRLVPGRGVKSERLLSQARELKLRLELPEHLEVRGFVDRGTVVFQIPKDGADRYYVDTDTLWAHAHHPESSTTSLRTPVGEDAGGEPVFLDLSDSDSPHLLIGGTTGSGKSVALESILEGFCAAHPPERLRLFLVDPKGTELIGFEDRPHMEGQLGVDGEDAIEILDAAVSEMERRYKLFKSMKKERGARIHKLVDYNELVGPEAALPWHLIVLDEYADLTSDKDERQRLEPLLQRITQKARASGIHVIVATQKPSAEVLSTAIRSNLPAQLALRVKTASDSRIVMDETGAETLAGKGDAFLKTQKGVVRVQTAQYTGPAS